MTRQNRRNSLINHRGNGAINYTSCMGIGGHIPSHPAKPNRAPSREDARAKLIKKKTARRRKQLMFFESLLDLSLGGIKELP
jgi:hypothetical protein